MASDCQIQQNREWADLDALREDNQRLTSMLAAIQDSRSWKLTAPLRAWAALRRESAVDRMVKRHQRRIRRNKTHDTIIGQIPQLLLRQSTVDPRVCAVIHVHYQDLAHEIAARLALIPKLNRVYVTHGNHVPRQTLYEIFGGLHLPTGGLEIIEMENRGRDVLPFVSLIPRLRESGCNVFLKLHTKRSPHLANDGGSSWRRSLLDGLIPGAPESSTLASLIANNDDVQFAVPMRWAAGRESWGRNKRRAHSLARRAGIKDLKQIVFPAGSMFWCGPSMLDMIEKFDLSERDFEVESQQLDGTTAHAIERLFGARMPGRRAIRVLYDPIMLKLPYAPSAHTNVA